MPWSRRTTNASPSAILNASRPLYFVMLAVVAAIAFSAARCRASGDDTSDYQATAREYYRRSKIWIVPATMAEKNGLALLATGSNIVAVHTPNGASDFPDQTLYKYFNSPPSAPIFAALPFGCLGLPPKSGVAAGMNLAPLQEFSHIPVSAYAAMPFLRQHAIRLDPSAGRIDVLSSPAELSDGIRLNIEWAKELPCVPVKLPVLGERPFILETGKSGNLDLSPDRAQSLERMGHLVRVQASTNIVVYLVGGEMHTIEEPMYVLRWLEFGGVRFHNVQVDIGSTDKIGLGLLHYFRTTLDFPGNTVCLDQLPSAESIEFPMNASGLTLGFHDSDRLVVNFLIAGFPAERRGIEMGDKVLSLNGKAPHELTLFEIQKMLSVAGSTVALEIQRADRQFHVDLALEHPFPWPPQWRPELPEFDPGAMSEE